MRCSAYHAGPSGCQAPVSWVIKAASTKLYACGRHLHRVCLQMIATGATYMTVTIEDPP